MVDPDAGNNLLLLCSCYIFCSVICLTARSARSSPKPNEDDGIVYHAGVRREVHQAFFFRGVLSGLSAAFPARDRPGRPPPAATGQEADVPANMVRQIARIISVCSQPVGHQYPACLLPAIGSQLEIAAWETAKVHRKSSLYRAFFLFVDSTYATNRTGRRIAIMPDIFIAVSGSEEHGTAFSISFLWWWHTQSEPGMVRKR